MKREILCTDCEETHKKLFPNESPYEGEHVKFVSGKARFDMLCDSCNKAITPKEDACAFSIYADYGGVPYFPWEPEYLEINK